MNKSELITNMAKKSGMQKKDLENGLNAFIECIGDALANGDKVQLVGFGTFEVRDRQARIGQNPHTGEKVQIPPTKAPAFKAGKPLKDRVNE